MIHGVKDQPVHENFTVSDSGGNLIAGIDTTTGFVPYVCLLYTSPSPRDRTRSRMPSSA